MEDTKARLWLSALEKQSVEQTLALASLRSELPRLSQAQESASGAAAAAFVRLSQVQAEVAGMQSPGAAMQAQFGEVSSVRE
jgi:hypothetical protein